MAKEIIKEEELKKVYGGQEEQQYVCKKCGNIIDINTAEKKVVNTESELGASSQYGYWCEHCQDYVAIIPIDGLPEIDIDLQKTF